MQSTRSCSEINIPLLAVPQTRSAVHTLLAIERGQVIVASRDGLSRAHFDAQFRFAFATEFGANKDHVIGISGWCLHATAHQQCILMGDQQLAVERNLWPAIGIHDAVVEGTALCSALPL